MKTKQEEYETIIESSIQQHLKQQSATSLESYPLKQSCLADFVKGIEAKEFQRQGHQVGIGTSSSEDVSGQASTSDTLAYPVFLFFKNDKPML